MVPEENITPIDELSEFLFEGIETNLLTDNNLRNVSLIEVEASASTLLHTSPLFTANTPYSYYNSTCNYSYNPTTPTTFNNATANNVNTHVNNVNGNFSTINVTDVLSPNSDIYLSPTSIDPLHNVISFEDTSSNTTNNIITYTENTTYCQIQYNNSEANGIVPNNINNEGSPPVALSPNSSSDSNNSNSGNNEALVYSQSTSNVVFTKNSNGVDIKKCEMDGCNVECRCDQYTGNGKVRLVCIHDD